MKSLFDLSLRGSFVPMPRSAATLGQSDSPYITSVDQGPPAADVPNLYTSVDQGPPAQDIPNLYTSVDQGPAAESVPGLVTQQDLQKSLETPSASTDWGKVATALVKGAGDSYTAYQKAQSTFNSARAKAGLPPMTLQSAASSGISPNVLFVVGGLVAVSLLVVLIRA